MKSICDALEVARSTQYESLARPPKVRERYRKKESDAEILGHLQALLAARPACGYRALTAHLNRFLAQLGKPRVNHKLIYRIMRAHNLLLPKQSSRIERTHEGKIAVPESNTRWCSDGFEIACSNGERVRVAFSLDCCDRDVLAYVATTGGLTGQIIRDLMVLTLRHGFPRESRRRRLNGSRTTGPAISTRKRLGLAGISASCPSRRPSGARKVMGWLNPLSAPSSAPTWLSATSRARPKSWRSFRNGSWTTGCITLIRHSDGNRRRSSEPCVKIESLSNWILN